MVTISIQTKRSLLIWLSSLLRSKRRMLCKLKLSLKLPRRPLKRRLLRLLLMLRPPLMLLQLRLRLSKRLLRPLLKPPEKRPKKKLRLLEMPNTPLKWLLRMLLKKLSSMPPRLSTKLNSI